MMCNIFGKEVVTIGIQLDSRKTAGVKTGRRSYNPG